MSIFRSYIEKNNTLIEGNESNNSQNPVGEVSYGTPDATVSRIIFKLGLDDLASKISTDGILESQITSHKLVLKNTIANRPDLLGKKSYSEAIERASSFQLELFTLVEDWDEGSGYDLLYTDASLMNYGITPMASNWYSGKTGQLWESEGAFNSTGSTVIGTQSFPKGNEDFSIDVTDYVNAILYSGETNYGLGIKFTDAIEALTTVYRKAVAFHLKHTHTVFEPYIETIIDDVISDDRKYFFMDKTNSLYLYSSAGDVTVSGVTIYDYEGEIVTTITGDNITRVKKGVYKIELSVDSSVYPDSVIFHDSWTIVQNGKTKVITQDFYLIASDKYYSFDLSNSIDPANFHFSYYGLKSGEYIKRGDKRKIEVLIKQLYSTQDDNLPLDISYRLYIKQGGRTHMDVIPFTQVNRTFKGYEFELDTSWLVPQDYFLELKLSNNSIFTVKSPIGFTIVNDEAFSA